MPEARAIAKKGTPLSKAGGLPAVRNRYEASIPMRDGDAYIPAFVRDARIDANAFTRYELCRKARYERRNNWLLKRLQSVDVKYTVGPHGHKIIPHSSDEEWNKAMTEAYYDWCETPFRDSALPMFQGHHLARKEMHVDGEVFANCTYLKLSGQRAVPAIELIEAHRVSSPGTEFSWPNRVTDTVDLIGDGVQYTRDSYGEIIGRPDGFHIRTGLNGEKWRFFKSFNPRRPIDGGVIHLCDPDRIGMARVVSEYAPVLNEIADLFLMSILEIDKAKANASYAGFLETWSGEMPGTMSGRFGGSTGPTSSLPIPGGETDADLRKRLNQMSAVVQAKIQALKPGEKMNWAKSDSPSASTQWLWKFIIERVCVARDIPMSLVLPESLQGTTVRAVMDDAQIGFNLQFAINARAAVQQYRFFADWARYNVEGLTDAPKDWAQCQVVPPPSINVDFGRNMSAMILGINAGIYDYDTIVGRDGGTAEDRMRRKGRQIARAKKIAAELTKETGYEVSAEEILGNLADVASKMSATEAEEDGEATGKENDPKTKFD